VDCPACGADSIFFESALILGKYSGNFHRCGQCSFVTLHNPAWLAEAYESPINDSDVGIVSRNLAIAPVLHLLFRAMGVRSVLDYGAGTGLLVRMLRDLGHDTAYFDRFPDNLFAKGFEANLPLEQYGAVVAIEVAEHMVNPIDFFQDLFAISSLIILSTEMLPEPTPSISAWYYYGQEHGQHVSFYTERSLRHLAKRFEANYFYLGGLHVFSREKEIPLWVKVALRKRRVAALLSAILPVRSLIPADFFAVSGRSLS
jgi:SAM-dependent methyltransferase